ncbi:hypothetical protein HZS_7680 [Henneguya salminicola]|nr:hypothetical protein HZS_7680 [Henneguya salminicola]
MIFDTFLPQLLAYPNPNDPLNHEAASLYIESPEIYRKRVSQYILRYASDTAIGLYELAFYPLKEPPEKSEDEESLSSISCETDILLREKLFGITINLDESNYRLFHVKIDGPVETPYEGGVFEIDLFLPEDYPITPPKVRFLTRIYHPNIDKIGRVCLDILKDKWSPALQINKVILSLQALIGSPNPKDPLDNEIAKHWTENENDAIETARKWTLEFAKPPAQT